MKSTRGPKDRELRQVENSGADGPSCRGGEGDPLQRQTERAKERKRSEEDEDREESSRQQPLITGLDLIMVANGGRIGRFSVGDRIERGGR